MCSYEVKVVMLDKSKPLETLARELGKDGWQYKESLQCKGDITAAVFVRDTAVVKYEHLFLHFSGHDKIETIIGEREEEGWEGCAMAYDPDGNLSVMMKRKCVDKSEGV